MFQSEAEMVRVEGGRPRNICHLITHAVQAEDANWLCLVHHMLSVCSTAPDFELEHADIELAKASWIANDLEPRDLGVREREGQYSGQLAACCEDQSNRSIDERRLYESQPSRHRDQLSRPCRSSPEFARRVGGVRCPPSDACRAIDADDGVGIEHGEETLEVACARGPQKRLDHFALTRPAGV